MGELPAVLEVPRTDAIYNCHGYLTKIPVGAIEPFIEAFTIAGDTVVDMFAGSGMTGLAAARVGRRAQLSDISALGRHIALGYLAEVSEADFETQAARACTRARGRLGGLYRTIRAEDGEEVEMVRTVWSAIYRCPDCGAALNYFEAMTDEHTRRPDHCGSCRAEFVPRRWARVGEQPVRLALRNGAGRIKEQAIHGEDLALIDRASSDPRQSLVPSVDIEPAREMFRRCALQRSGWTRTRDFFSARNAIALFELWSAIEATTNPRLRHKLRFAFTAILPRASRRYQWGPKRPLNAQNQTYYVGPVHYEWNVFELFERKVAAARRADRLVFAHARETGAPPDVDYRLSSADALAHLSDASVDYVFTDPPFGSNIFYSDMNLFAEAWLSERTDPSLEAVIPTARSRREEATARYEALLTRAFAEAYRVLKPGSHMSVVFGNSRGSVWAVVQRALCAAGFEAVPVEVTILDKGQRSIKGLASGSQSVVTVDLVLTMRKPNPGRARVAAPLRPPSRTPSQTPSRTPSRTQVRDPLAELDPEQRRSPSYVYASLLRAAIRAGESVADLHLEDLLMQLQEAGYALDPKTGLLHEAARADALG